MTSTIRTDCSRTALALHGTLSARELERRALAAGHPLALVRLAGAATARLALALAPHASRIWVAAGSGNNGADGLHAAAWLARAGKRVSISLPRALRDDPGRRTAETSDAWGAIESGLVQVAEDAPRLGPDDLAIDALLGLGASRAPEGELAARVNELNGCGAPVLAVDIPTGLHADTGQPLGSPIVTAAHTISLLALHPGLFTAAGRDHAGIVWFDALGVSPADHGVQEADALLSAPASARRALAPARHADHKGSQGDVAVVGGGPGMSGAAILAARAALSAGAGRIYVDVLAPAASTLDIVRPELMFRPGWWRGDASELSKATVVCGCGGGQAVGLALPSLITQVHRLVLDADALNLIARDPELQRRLGERGANPAMDTVLTPHPLEAARLLGTDVATVQDDRLKAATELSMRHRCVVVLKGSGSIIASPGRIPVINRTGNAALATAGTGDVLAGWLGGTWARLTEDAFDAAVAAVYTHGLAAERSGLATLRAADLSDVLAGLRRA